MFCCGFSFSLVCIVFIVCFSVSFVCIVFLLYFISFCFCFVLFCFWLGFIFLFVLKIQCFFSRDLDFDSILLFGLQQIKVV